MTVSYENSKVIFQASKPPASRRCRRCRKPGSCTCCNRPKRDPGVTLVRLAKEEEASASPRARTSPASVRLLMQNHGFLASINGIVSLRAALRIPLLMLISYRGEFGERDPWQTEGGGVTEDVLRALRIPFAYARRRRTHVAPRDPQGADAGPVARTSRSRCCSAAT